MTLELEERLEKLIARKVLLQRQEEQLRHDLDEFRREHDEVYKKWAEKNLDEKIRRLETELTTKKFCNKCSFLASIGNEFFCSINEREKVVNRMSSACIEFEPKIYPE
ncbi:MAG: hypothetical protein ACRCZB_04985 [Bacteroidales bacterium]